MFGYVVLATIVMTVIDLMYGKRIQLSGIVFNFVLSLIVIAIMKVIFFS